MPPMMAEPKATSVSRISRLSEISVDGPLSALEIAVPSAPTFGPLQRVR
jgi:hypothetical protein